MVGLFGSRPAYESGPGQYFLFWNDSSWVVSEQLGGNALVYLFNGQDVGTPDQLTAEWQPVAVNTTCAGCAVCWGFE